MAKLAKWRNLQKILQIPQILQMQRVFFAAFAMKGIDNGGQRRKRFFTVTGKRELDNCGKKAKKASLAQETGVFAAAVGGGAANEGELLRQGEKDSTEYKVLSTE